MESIGEHVFLDCRGLESVTIGAGLVPTDASSEFKVGIEFVDGAPVITWEPDLGSERTYTIQGKASLSDDWGEADSNSRFFRVSVGLEYLVEGLKV